MLTDQAPGAGGAPGSVPAGGCCGGWAYGSPLEGGAAAGGCCAYGSPWGAAGGGAAGAAAAAAAAGAPAGAPAGTGAATAGFGVPQDGQKRAPPSIWLPHCWQKTCAGAMP